MKLFAVLCFCLLLMVMSCSTKNETKESQDSTALTAENEISKEDLEDATDEEEIEDFNEQDNGDPGLSAQIVNDEDQSPEVRYFLIRLRQNLIPANVTSGKRVLVVRPGPGVYPVFTFLEAETNLADSEPFVTYLRDSVFQKSLTCYRLVNEKCSIIDGFPEGVYFRTINFQDVEFDSVDESEDLELKSFLSQFQTTDESMEFIIKYTTNAGKETFLHLLTYLKDGQFVIAVVDQRDCSA